MAQYILPLLSILTTIIWTTTSQSNYYQPKRRPIGNQQQRPSYGTSMNGLKDLQLFYEWNELEYEFPTHLERMRAIEQGLFVPGNGVPIDVAPHYRADGSCRIFVTIPRFTTGIPMSLAVVTNTKGAGGPKLLAYPHYSVHSSHGHDCNGITSVFRVAIDECDRMWVVDTGRIGSVQYCPPQLLVFDLNTDTLVHRYKFPQSQYKTGVSLFVTPIVDVRDPPPTGRCMNAKVYIADVTGFGLIVYDSIKNTSWRIQNKLMYPYPECGTFTIAGESFDLMDGIIGMEISPKDQRERFLYFHSLAGSVENKVPLSIIDNQTIWEQDSESVPRAFRVIGDRNIQSIAEAMDSKGNLFFGVMDPIAIAYWNIHTPYNTNSIKIIAQNNKTLQFASGVKIVKNKLGREELWVSTCRFQKVMTGSKNSHEVNFRIQRCYVDDLLNGRIQTCSVGACSSPKTNLILHTDTENGIGLQDDNLIFV